MLFLTYTALTGFHDGPFCKIFFRPVIQSRVSGAEQQQKAQIRQIDIIAYSAVSEPQIIQGQMYLTGSFQ
ncbi:hypothetical protein B1H58_20330 (plasmid) [Pantoea alhagi]|uniref:Uncharacterized protein n=1 Tax=Pantoea alhagi TaxID=1891675 RepID=A0A1W6BBD2_9GAMM|nr:hypothetical protein B1H58_20330 [Pantoea alhagi]